MRSIAYASLFLAAAAGGAAAQTLRIDREKVLYNDMHVTPVGPFVSTAAPPAGGVVWSRRIIHATAVPAVRVHVQVRRGRPGADWRIRLRDLAGREVESIDGGSPLLASGGVWSGEIPGRGVEVELVTDSDAQGLEIAIDRYAFRVISAIPESITGLDQRIPIRRAPADVRGWAGPIARLSFISEGEQFVCTGFLVTRDLLLTNEHCLGTEEAALSAIAEFGFDSLDATPAVTRVIKLEAADVPLDYALVRLRQAMPDFGRVSFGSMAVSEDQALVIVEHPAGEFKQASIDDCKVRTASRAGVSPALTDFGHLCDTLGGSSGSPVFDRQSGRVVGLHHLGFLSGVPDPVNQGVHIGLVLEDIKRRAPAAHAELTAP
jgi:hypothetical protein